MPRRFSFIPKKPRKRRSIFVPVNVVEVLEDGHQYIVNYQGQRHEMLSQGATSPAYQLTEGEWALGRLVGGKVGDQIFYPSVRRPGSVVMLGLMDDFGNPRVFWTENIRGKTWQENSVGLPVVSQQQQAFSHWFEFSPFDRDKAWYSYYRSAIGDRRWEVWYNSGLTTGGTWSKIYDQADYITDVGLGAFTSGPHTSGIKHDRVADNNLYMMVWGRHGATGNRGYLGRSVTNGSSWTWTGYPDNANGNSTSGLRTHSLAPSWKQAGKLGIAWLGVGLTGSTDEIILTSDDFGATMVVKVYQDGNGKPDIGAQIAHYENADRFHHLDNSQSGSLDDWNYHTADFWATKTDLGFGDDTIEMGSGNQQAGMWAAWDNPTYWVMNGRTPTGAGYALVRTPDDGDTWVEEPGWDANSDWDAVEVNVRRTLEGEYICVGSFDSPQGRAYDGTFVHFGPWGGGHFGNAGAINYAGNLDNLIKNNVQSGGGDPKFIGWPASIWFDRTEVLIP